MFHCELLTINLNQIGKNPNKSGKTTKMKFLLYKMFTTNLKLRLLFIVGLKLHIGCYVYHPIIYSLQYKKRPGC